MANPPQIHWYEGLFIRPHHLQSMQRQMLERFANMYGKAIGTGAVKEYLGQTGLDALSGADILKAGLSRYSSSVEYGTDPIAKSLRDVATIHTADVGTRVFYTAHTGFDTHASQQPTFERLWTEVSRAISDFWDDLHAHDADDNVVMILFSEFGRRVRDNGSGTDHGAGGVSFAIGPAVKGGQYGVYPETRAEALDQGELVIFPSGERPVPGKRGPVRLTTRHGVATVTSGRRYTLGLIFHDAR